MALLALSARPGAEETGPAAGVKVMVFDVFGTVVDWRLGLTAEGQALGIPTVDWAWFADAWAVEYARSVSDVRTGKLPWTRLDVLLRRALDELLDLYGVQGLSESERDNFSGAWCRLPPWPDAVEGLTRLRQGFVIAPLSNGNLGMTAALAAQAGLPWDYILSAELSRHYKTDPEVYLSVLDFFGLVPSQVMMVASHWPDLKAAKAVGLRTAFVYRPVEAPTPPPVSAVDVFAGDLCELALLLGL
jgi:2-haloacid dehalogenase